MLSDAVDAGALARSNVVSLLDCVRKDDRTSLIFEFVEGKDFIKDLPNFSERDVARYMRELLIALAHVHRSAKLFACPSPRITRAQVQSHSPRRQAVQLHVLAPLPNCYNRLCVLRAEAAPLQVQFRCRRRHVQAD